MSIAVVLLAAVGSIAAFLYFKMLISIEESALQPKTNLADSRTRDSRLPCTAEEIECTHINEQKQIDVTFVIPDDEEPTHLKTALAETASIGHVPDIPERIERQTAVDATRSMVHLSDLQGGFAAMSAKFNMMATPQWSILCGTENNSDKEWLSNEATTLYGGLNHATENAATRGVTPDQATASALRHMRESNKRKKGSRRSVSPEANASRGSSVDHFIVVNSEKPLLNRCRPMRSQISELQTLLHRLQLRSCWE